MDFPKKYPQSVDKFFGKFKANGLLHTGSPAGVTLHYTADRSIDRVVTSLVNGGLGYHAMIDRSGVFYQCMPFDAKLWHAGKALWNSMSPNSAHLGIALVSWGELQLRDGLYRAWNNEAILPSEVKQRAGRIWDIATESQEKTLMTFLRWAVANGLSAGNVCGHDECAVPHGRKSDPGGVLLKSMHEMRAELAEGQDLA